MSDPTATHERGARHGLRVWRRPELPGLEGFVGTTARSYARHFHDAYCIPLVEAGAMRSLYRGAEQTLPAGAYDILEPGEAHTGAPADRRSWAYRGFHIQPWLFERLSAGKAARPRSGERQIFDILRRAHRLLEVAADTLEAQTLLTTGLAALSSTTDRSKHRDLPKAHRVRDLLAAGLTEPASIAWLADQVDLHPAHLVRVFRDAFGLPPHAFRRQLRIQRAQQLIVEGRPLAEVAATVGFTDQSHMTRLFRSHLGVTPRAYAARKQRTRPWGSIAVDASDDRRH
jgi:AraC family transcriptional regulator